MEKIPVVKRLCVLLGVFAFLFLSASENAAARSTPPPTLPCSTPGPLLVTLGDSITHGVAASGESKAYPALLAAKIGYQLLNLGISGETEIPEPNRYWTGKNNAGVVFPAMGGITRDEVKNIPPNAALVTLYVGTNDLWLTEGMFDINLSNVGQGKFFISEVGHDFAVDMRETVAAIHTRAPNARVMIATDINPADKGSIVNLTSRRYIDYRQDMTDLTNEMNRTIAASGAIIVNLGCDPRLYDPNNYANQWDVHPNDNGHKIIANDFYQAYLADDHTLERCRYDRVIGLTPSPSPSSSPSPSQSPSPSPSPSSSP